MSEINLQNNNENNPEFVFLTSAENDINATIIESMLKSYEIPVLKKPSGPIGVTAVYKMATIFGVDIFVPPSLLDAAKELLEAEPDFDGIDFDEEEAFTDIPSENDNPKDMQSIIRRILLWTFWLAWIIGIIYAIYIVIGKL